MAEATEAEGERSAEEREIERRRKAALRIGLSEVDAELFAVGDTTMKTFRHCLRRGATLAQIAKIVV